MNNLHTSFSLSLPPSLRVSPEHTILSPHGDGLEVADNVVKALQVCPRGLEHHKVCQPVRQAKEEKQEAQGKCCSDGARFISTALTRSSPRSIPPHALKVNVPILKALPAARLLGKVHIL